MTGIDFDDIERRMNGALGALNREYGGLRTGRASVGLLEPVQVEAYGSRMPLNQVGTISIPESRMITVQVWDRSMIKAVDKAIRDAGLGLNPMADGQLIRVPIPELSEERRIELVKVANKYTEQARVSVRNIRRDSITKIKGMEKDSDISEDEMHRHSDHIQKLTDDFIKKIDQAFEEKEKEIKQI